MNPRIYISPKIDRTKASDFFSRLEKIISGGNFEITNDPNKSHIAILINENEQLSTKLTPVRINLWLWDIPFSSNKDREMWAEEYQKDILGKILFAKDLLLRFIQLQAQ